jgi:enoyl-CoA hydratase
MADDLLLVDYPLPHVKRLTMNRPEKRNALFHPLRGAIIKALQEGDMDSNIKVMIIRGNGPSFSAGYDLGGGNEGLEYPHFTAPGEGQWPRHVTDTWMSIWDMSKPVIAQVHGYCLAGGSELATGCDLVYMGPTTPRWVTRPSGSVYPTCTSTRGSSGCARRWKCS